MKVARASLLVAPFVLFCGTAWSLTDPFDEDPTTNPEWEYYKPSASTATSTEDGWFRFTFLPGALLDHWSTVDNAVQLRRSDIPEDFIIETRVNIVGSGDPLAPTFPPQDDAYQAALMVYFAPLDVFYWGPYRGTALWLERSGQNGLCIVDPALQELSLQVKKVGTEYSFSYRAEDTDSWTLVCTRTATQVPQQVGLIFKTWSAMIVEQTFDFDYFSIDEVPVEAPTITACLPTKPDRAYIGMPYVMPLDVAGYPVPEVTLKTAPAGAAYDPALDVISGWTPDSYAAAAFEIEAKSDAGTATESWGVDVQNPSLIRDDEFVDDPRDNGVYWQFYEPQTGIIYSSVTEDGADWWRLEVPQLGDFGLDFDTWTTADRAPQLWHPVGPDEDFLIETRVRVPTTGQPPTAGSPWLAGLVVNFNGTNDVIHWNIGGERTSPAGALSNVFAERSGLNDVCDGYAAGVSSGEPVELRLERRCSTYIFYFRASGEAAWNLCGRYQTADEPLYVGLIMKTWGGGTPFTADFDYFSFVRPGPKADFTATPPAGPEPLSVALDATSSTSAGGAITAYAWDFGDGQTGAGATTSHTYTVRGDYVITLTVTDATNDKGAISKDLRVNFGSGDVSPWTSEDIGNPLPSPPGGARLEGQDCVRIYSTGRDIFGSSDQFHFVHQTVSGDGSIVAQLSSAQWRASAKIGVMIREDLSPGARNVCMLFQNQALGSKWSFQRRESADSLTETAKLSPGTFIVPDAWVKLERAGNDFIGSYSTDGSAWTELGRVTLDFPADAHFGLVATARSTATATYEIEGVLCNVKLLGGVGPGKTIFHRGDSNGDGGLNITDGIFVLNFLFLGGPTPGCLEAANANDDPQLNITDGIYILNFLFLGGPAPLDPGPVGSPCGPDPESSPTDLGCETYDRC